MSRQALASAMVLAGGFWTTVVAVVALVVAARSVTALGGVLLYGCLGVGLLLLLLGALAFRAPEPPDPQTGA